MRPFRELRVWQAGHQLTLDIYRVTHSFPASEVYGLTSQMRRSCASIPTNIAEGCVRTDAEFRQFLRVALGSASELEYQLLLSRDLQYLPEQEYLSLQGDVEGVKRMLTVFIRRSGTETRPNTAGRRLNADGLSEVHP